MNGRKKPRQPRPMRNPVQCAMSWAGRLTAAEVNDIMAPVKSCLKALREGIATQLQFDVLHTTILAADRIEQSRIVRGLTEHIAAAQTALDAINARANRTGQWQPTALYFSELDALNTAINLHEYQLKQLSAGELHRIIQKLKATTLSQGGQVLRVTNAQVMEIQGVQA